MTAPAFASVAVAAGNAPIVNPNSVAFITTEGTGSRLHLINQRSMTSSLSAAAAAAALGFTIVATPTDLAGASGPTLISVTRTGETQASLINPAAISYVDPTSAGGAVLHLLVTGETPAFATAAPVATISGLIAAANVISLNRKSSSTPSLLTRDQVITVLPNLNSYDGITGAMLALRNGDRFETASATSAVLTALTS